jgi:2-oxoglutarate dehydrogenase E1 component
VQFRSRFNKDVVIDLWSYRKYGHNEADDPSFTQPHMVRAIERQPTIREQFVHKLESMGKVTRQQAEEIAVARKQLLESQLAELTTGQKVQRKEPPSRTGEAWSTYVGGLDGQVPDVPTGVTLARLQALSERICHVPDGFHPHKKLQKWLELRREMGRGQRALDWGMGEALAYAALVDQGVRVRLTGQDCRRGTFSHRHAALIDFETAEPYVPLQHIRDGQGIFELHDSPLSEEAAVGFEYGYSRDMPEGLVIWEAQFGDFANGAQVMIDQFIASCEDKWFRLSGLTLFLPHGYEGQGPEHSSARLERFLQLCAEHNMQVCVPSTPAQMFHLLRRQMLRHLRKPLVVLTPKSLLRHRLSVSTLADLARGRFHPIIEEVEPLADEAVTRVVFCSGKVYFDLAEQRRNESIQNVAIVRIEELYPFPIEEYARAIGRYRNAHEIVWCQEEPQNQGAWYQIRHRLQEPLGKHQLFYAGRPGAAAPASGIHALHVRQQQALVSAALSSSTQERAAGLSTVGKRA